MHDSSLIDKGHQVAALLLSSWIFVLNAEQNAKSVFGDLGTIIPKAKKWKYMYFVIYMVVFSMHVQIMSQRLNSILVLIYESILPL